MRNLYAISAVIAIAAICLVSVGCKDKPAAAVQPMPSCMPATYSGGTPAATPDPISTNQAPVTLPANQRGPVTGGDQIVASTKYVVVEGWTVKDGKSSPSTAQIIVFDDAILQVPEQYREYWHENGERIAQATPKSLPLGWCAWDRFEIPKDNDGNERDLSYLRPSATGSRVSLPGPTADGSMYHESGLYYVHTNQPTPAAKPTPATKPTAKSAKPANKPVTQGK